MDSGCLAPGESLDEDYDVNRPLRAEEALGIIDQLLCHEVSRGPANVRWSGNLTSSRWHGISGILYRRPSSRTSISRRC